MARKTTRTNPRGEVSRQALLDATLRLAGERGYVGTTMAQITKATGLPASSVYWHFGSKDDLLADALEHGFRQWRSAARPWMEMDLARSRRDRILDQLVKATGRLDGELGFWRMGLLLALETGPAVGNRPRERFLEVRREALGHETAWWSACLKADAGVTAKGPARMLAQLTLAGLDGLYLTHLSDPELDLAPVLEMLADGLDAAAEHLVANPSAVRARGRRTPPPAAPTSRALSRDSRVRLLEAAASVAAESGYDGASISRICQRAGLPASSLYWQFTDKDDLLARVVDHSYQEWYAAQPAWDPLDDGDVWHEELLTHLGASLGSLSQQPAFLRIGYFLLLLRREDPPAARDTFLEVRGRARTVVAEWFATSRPDLGEERSDLMSLLLMTLSDGLFFSNQLDTPGWDPKVFADLIVQVLVESARVHA